MPGFPFTSTHRPIGAHFLDFSDCPTDDSSYDEARGPECLVHHCVDYDDSEDLDDPDYYELNRSDESDEEIVDNQYQYGDYYLYDRDYGDDYDWRNYENYNDDHNHYEVLVESAVEVGEDWHSVCPQYGHGRIELNASTSWDSRMNTRSWNPKRNRGRQPRNWWYKLAIERGQSKRVYWSHIIT